MRSERLVGLENSPCDPVIVEKTLGLVLGPSTASFLKQCTLTNKAVGLYIMTCPNLLRGEKALILVPSDC